MTFATGSELTPEAKRDVLRVALGVFAVAYGTNVSTPFLGLYKDRLGLSESETMAIFVVYVAGIFSTLFVAGPLSDRYGRRPLVIPFVAVSALSSGMLILGQDQFWVLLAARLLLGMVSGCVLGVGAAWLQELLGAGNEQRAALILTLVTYVGFGTGPITSALMAEYLPWPLTMAFVVHICATTVVLPGLFLAPETVGMRNPRPKMRLAFGVPAESRSVFLRVIVPSAIWVFGFASVSFALFPVLLADSVQSSKVLVAGVAGTLTALSGVVARPLVNRLGARSALVVAVVAGLSGYILGTAAYFTDQWLLLIPCAIVLGTSSGTITAGCLTLLGELSDDETRGACVSTFYLLAYPGMAVPLVVTTFAAHTSMDTALIVMCLVGAFATCVAVTLNRRTPSGLEPAQV